jgi:uncharacterized alkaline shock family protein YloU
VRELVTPEGRLVLTEAALADVVRAAALACPGVVAMAPRGLPEEIRGLLRGDGDPSVGIGVEVSGDGDRVRVAVDVVVAYGVHIPGLAAAVAEAVRDALRREADVVAERVLVRVQAVRRLGAPGRGRAADRA